jgi:hypothetical protein
MTIPYSIPNGIGVFLLISLRSSSIKSKCTQYVKISNLFFQDIIVSIRIKLTDVILLDSTRYVFSEDLRVCIEKKKRIDNMIKTLD